jgi:hypothetical protein
MVQAVVQTTVTGLQNNPVSNVAPAVNQSLTWNGTAWAPAGPFVTLAQIQNAPYAPINLVDNSGFAVNQRGFSSGSSLGQSAYGLDRWKAGSAGVTMTVGTSNTAAAVNITAGSIYQVLEPVNFATGTYMLSWSGTAQGRIGNGNGGLSGAYAASPIPYAAVANSSFVTLEFSGGTLGQVQLQLGSVATSWAPRPWTEELYRCFRFYQGPINNMTLQTYSSAGFPVSAYSAFVIPMRTAPTVLNFVINQNTNGGNGFISPQDANGFNYGANAVSTGPVGLGYSCAFSADL